MRKGRRRTPKNTKSIRRTLQRIWKSLGRALRWIRASRFRRRLGAGGLIVLAILLWASVDLPPSRTNDLCHIFSEKPSWYRILRNSSQEFGVPEAVQMAIFHQESSFRATARPPRRKILWILPGPRPSTAFGYAQALDSTWDEYRTRTHRLRARRDRFQDAAHFMGWYLREIHRLTDIERDDAYHLYLAYHEGPAGFRRGTHRQKAWLLQVARQVDNRADSYQKQLDGCRAQLEAFPWHRMVWALLLICFIIVCSCRLGTWSWKKAWPQWTRRRRPKRKPRRRRS